ncbi:MAG: hypothetical protein HY231_17740 [Acidobacteria bacterium]|nr:hypothetical protein [Acidobacteriota bacterium]
MKFFLSIIFFLMLASGGMAQSSGSTAKNRPLVHEEKSSDEWSQDANLPPEMRSRLAIERAKSEYRKIIEDARKLNDLSADLAKHYHEKNQLSSDDVKNVGTIEKLAKRILSFAGGSEEKMEAAKALSLGEAISQLDKSAENVRKFLEVESRHVISAKLIADANQAINLAQVIRHFHK